MRVAGIAVWVGGAVIVLIWMYGVRDYVRRGSGVTQQSVNMTMLFIIALAAVTLLPLSNFHLLWLFPLSFVLGTLSLVFPFSLLSIPGRLFGRLCTLGLDPAEVVENTARVRRFRALIRSGIPPQEAEDLVQSLDERRQGRADLIRKLAKKRIREDPVAFALGFDDRVVDSLSEIHLMGIAEGAIVINVETYAFLKQEGVAEAEIFQRIEAHRSSLGLGELPAPLTLEKYIQYRMDLEFKVGAPISKEFVTEAVQIAREHFGCQ